MLAPLSFARKSTRTKMGICKQVLLVVVWAAAFLPACEPVCKNQALPLGKAHLLQEMEKEIEQAYPSYPKPYQIKFDTAAMEGRAMVCWGNWKDYLVPNALLIPDTTLCDYSLFQYIYFEGPNPSTVFFEDFQTFTHFVNSLDRQPTLEELDFYMDGVFRLARKDSFYLENGLVNLNNYSSDFINTFFLPTSDSITKNLYYHFQTKKEEVLHKMDSIQSAPQSTGRIHFYTNGYYSFIAVFEHFTQRTNRRKYVFLSFFPYNWIASHPEIAIFE
jgi:hypothetical protein